MKRNYLSQHFAIKIIIESYNSAVNSIIDHIGNNRPNNVTAMIYKVLCVLKGNESEKKQKVHSGNEHKKYNIN
ncbi:MAG: hypothetical protein Q7T92_06640 [Lutibacter sp.]|nr:hypothetical protein [Lutibacter sp.]